MSCFKTSVVSRGRLPARRSTGAVRGHSAGRRAVDAIGSPVSERPGTPRAATVERDGHASGGCWSRSSSAATDRLFLRLPRVDVIRSVPGAHPRHEKARTAIDYQLRAAPPNEFAGLRDPEGESVGRFVRRTSLTRRRLQLGGRPAVSCLVSFGDEAHDRLAVREARPADTECVRVKSRPGEAIRERGPSPLLKAVSMATTNRCTGRGRHLPSSSTSVRARTKFGVLGAAVATRRALEGVASLVERSLSSGSHAASIAALAAAAATTRDLQRSVIGSTSTPDAPRPRCCAEALRRTPSSRMTSGDSRYGVLARGLFLAATDPIGSWRWAARGPPPPHDSAGELY